MSAPKITIFTCSYNKPQYVGQAIESVLAQTYPSFEYLILENSTDGLTRDIVRSYRDPRIRVIEVDLSPHQRRKFYAESYLKNTYTKEAWGQFIMYLSDDDILDPNCFSAHLAEFAHHPDQQINFHGWKVTYLGLNRPDEVIGVKDRYGLNTRRRPGRRIDGGAVMFRKELLSQITEPYFKLRWKDAHISDALFLNRLAQLATFYPTNRILHTKRITDRSAHAFISPEGQIVAYRPR